MQFRLKFVLIALFLPTWAFGQDLAASDSSASDVAASDLDGTPTAPTIACQSASDDVPAGHSYHGEAFNEGPRQAAQLMKGMAPLSFQTSTKSKSAQAFFEQGVSQLHGFWYLEAERSFRQAAKEDPDLAIAYWGMAMANKNNDQRARGFIDEAKLKSKSNTSDREQLYIDALDRYLPKESKDDDDEEPTEEQKEKRAERYIADLEKILHKYPNDIEAKAFLVVQLWMSDREGVKLTSRYAVNALQSEIFEENPMHPAHHYRIHLWDSPRPENALQSAALCGPSSPGIAHMWHMPGHIYSKLKRYSDAAWQQEASARVDHAHMIRTRLMPDQIHNFAHNNEWLVRNLIFVGRVQDAIDLSRNLISLPRHPKYNSLDKRGSYRYGRQRLSMVLTQYELWQQLVDEIDNGVLVVDEKSKRDLELLAWKGAAHFMLGQKKQGAVILHSLQRRRLELDSQWLDLVGEKSSDEGEIDDETQNPKDEGNSEDAEEDSKEETVDKDKLKKDRDEMRRWISLVAAASAAKAKRKKNLESLLERSKIDATLKARWLSIAGMNEEALEIAQKAAAEGKNEVRPLAVQIDLLWKLGKKEAAKRKFRQLRRIASHADLDTPLLKRLTPVTKAIEVEGDWRNPPKPAKDLGERPPLEQLGPFRWEPYQAPEFSVVDPSGEIVSSEAWSGKPRVLIFYLGFGCLHCIEQLHAFSPEVQRFRDAGLEVIGISNESVANLKLGIDAFDKAMNIPLFTDGTDPGDRTGLFKTFRCWDDFEDVPLHGTFLIDASGKVRWQDISYEPFMDVDFVLEEAKRLLGIALDE